MPLNFINSTNQINQAMDNPLINPGIGLIFWMTLAFAILLFILAKFAWPVIMKSLKDREETIDKALRSADIAREEVEKLKVGNEELLKQAAEERNEILRQAKVTTDKMINAAQDKANEEADRILEAARKNIEYERLQVIHELKNEIATLSINIAERLLGEELSDKEKSKEFVKKEIDNIQF